jgi:hypothetical protein
MKEGAAAKEKDAWDRAQQKRLDAEEVLEQYNKRTWVEDRHAELTDKVLKAREEELAAQRAYEEALKAARG